MTIKDVKIFSIESNLLSFPSYAICAVNRLNDKEIHGESFLLTIYKNKKAKLTAMEVLYNTDFRLMILLLLIKNLSLKNA
jgi:hypothetical protein